MTQQQIDEALKGFEALLRSQSKRNDEIKAQKEFLDFSSLDKIVIGTCGGDGIGPSITKSAQLVLEFMLKDEVKKGKVEFYPIEGLTIENRAAHCQSVPDEVLSQIKKCHVILKGPTTTPRAGDPWPNLESANVALRRELDLFANLRPVRVPEEGIDWTFFRENTEGAYAVGSRGIRVNEDISIDFTVTTTEGTERIARLAFEYAKNTGRNRLSIVTKANIIKATDGKFLNICREMAEEYPMVTTDDWYIDIMSAKLIDQKRRRDFRVFVLPNLYGDILTDEAAEMQGGVGTAGSANIGKRYAMFEAIHGSAPRMVEEGRVAYADPSSMLRAACMALSHIGYQQKADLMEEALDICQKDEKCRITGREDGATCEEFTFFVMDMVQKLSNKKIC